MMTSITQSDPAKRKVVGKTNKNDPEGVYLQNDLPKTLPKTMKNGANVVNLNEYKPIGTHWIPLDNSGT